MAGESGHALRSSMDQRSETEEQRQYEQEILAHQHYLRQSDDSETEVEKQTPHHGFTGKIRKFWDKKVKPAFPEAIADISLVKDVFTTESLIHKDIHDAVRYPEIMQIAQVRQGVDLGPEEKAFLVKRKIHVRNHFARYLGLDPDQVHPDDIPVIGFGGSGGGYRAMIGYLGYMTEMRKAGLWDLITYVAGVSGTCWSIAAYYTFANATVEHIF